MTGGFSARSRSGSRSRRWCGRLLGGGVDAHDTGPAGGHGGRLRARPPVTSPGLRAASVRGRRPGPPSARVAGRADSARWDFRPERTLAVLPRADPERRRGRGHSRVGGQERSGPCRSAVVPISAAIPRAQASMSVRSRKSPPVRGVQAGRAMALGGRQRRCVRPSRRERRDPIRGRHRPPMRRRS